MSNFHHFFAVSNGPGIRDDSSIASGSSGFGSLTKKKPNDGLPMDPAIISSIVTDSGISECSEPSNTLGKIEVHF